MASRPHRPRGCLPLWDGFSGGPANVDSLRASVPTCKSIVSGELTSILRGAGHVNQLWAYLSIYLFIYFWLCWVFVSVRGLSLIAASGGHSSSRCAGLSLSQPLLLRSTGSVVVAHGPSCSAACGILPDQGSNPRPLHWQADSQPLRHQGSPMGLFYLTFCVKRAVWMFTEGCRRRRIGQKE